MERANEDTEQNYQDNDENNDEDYIYEEEKDMIDWKELNLSDLEGKVWKYLNLKTRF